MTRLAQQMRPALAGFASHFCDLPTPCAQCRQTARIMLDQFLADLPSDMPVTIATLREQLRLSGCDA